MLDFSKSLKSLNNELTIIEPTSGIGGIVVEILKLQKQHNIFIVEIEESSREILNKLVNSDPDFLTLHETPDFLQFVNHIVYDMVIMNSPFHLRKVDFTYLDRDYFDIDFVQRAYYMLKDRGELIALVRTENTQKLEF
jgi:tRNA1(Val) A37 N6-methylase TrmN6